MFYITNNFENNADNNILFCLYRKGRVTKDENQPVKKSTQDEGEKRNSSSYQCHHQDKEQQNKSQTRIASAKSKRKKVDLGQVWYYISFDVKLITYQ